MPTTHITVLTVACRLEVNVAALCLVAHGPGAHDKKSIAGMTPSYIAFCDQLFGERTVLSCQTDTLHPGCTDTQHAPYHSE